jgi:hypothetical protein
VVKLSIRKLLISRIENQTDIPKLEKLRDYGLDLILSDPSIPDNLFTVEDKNSIVEIINERIDFLQ